MIMHGHNEIHYNAATIRAILEKHINNEVLQGNVTVNSVTIKQEGGSFTTIAHITSDPQPKKADDAR